MLIRYFLFTLFSILVNWVFSQSVSFESYLIAGSEESISFRSNSIISIDPDHETIYLLNSFDPYLEQHRLTYGMGSNSIFSISSYSITNGALLDDSTFSIYDRPEYGNTRLDHGSSGKFSAFYTYPQSTFSSVGDATFMTPCKRLGFFICDSESQEILSQDLRTECISIEALNLGFASDQKAYCIYELEEVNVLSSWDIENPNNYTSTNIAKLSSIPYLNKEEERIYYVKDVDFDQSGTDGKIVSIDYDASVDHEFSVQSSINLPRLVANNANVYLFEPYKVDFKIQHFNSSGTILHEITSSGKFIDALLLEDGNVVVATSSDLGAELSIFSSSLELLGSVEFGVPDISIHDLAYESHTNSFYLSGIVNTAVRLDDTRKPNALAFIKINMGDLRTSTNPIRKPDQHIHAD